MIRHHSRTYYRKRRKARKMERDEREAEVAQMIGNHVPVDTGEYREWRSR